MSVFGGGAQVQADLIEAIRGLSRTFSEAGSQARGTQSALAGFQPGNIGAMAGGAVGGPLGAAAGEMLGNNVFVNTALKTGREFTNDVFNNVAGDYAKYGSSFGSSFDSSLRQSFLNSFENKVPFFGDVAGEVTGVQRSAKARLKGLIDPAARGGAKFTDEELKPVAEFFQAEEARATQAGKQVDALFRDAKLISQAEESSPRWKELQSTIDALNDVFKNTTQYGAQINALLDMILGRSQR